MSDYPLEPQKKSPILTRAHQKEPPQGAERDYPLEPQKKSPILTRAHQLKFVKVVDHDASY